MKNIGGLKIEILRCAQNYKNILLIALWYKWLSYLQSIAQPDGNLLPSMSALI